MFHFKQYLCHFEHILDFVICSFSPLIFFLDIFVNNFLNKLFLGLFDVRRQLSTYDGVVRGRGLKGD